MDAVATDSRTFAYNSVVEVKANDMERVSQEVAEPSRRLDELMAETRRRPHSASITAPPKNPLT